MSFFKNAFVVTFFVLFALGLQGCGFPAYNSALYSIYPIESKGKNIVINGTEFQKTSFATVIPKHSEVTIPSANLPRTGNVFVWDRTITLGNYEMSQCEVTQELYEYVMGSLPHDDSESVYPDDVQSLRPATGMSWFDAVEFCNKLSKLCGYEEVYTLENISRKNNKSFIYSASVSYDFSKNGFRLPTEAEWEFAARGAGELEEDWNYIYPGSDNYKKIAWTIVNSSGYSDDELLARTHEVGSRQPNSLGLYDMAGNASEWCFDYWKCKQPGYETTIPEGDDYKYVNPVNNPGTFTDALVDSSEYKSRVVRGGCYTDKPDNVKNSYRYYQMEYCCAKYTGFSQTNIGIRLVRRP